MPPIWGSCDGKPGSSRHISSDLRDRGQSRYLVSISHIAVKDGDLREVSSRVMLCYNVEEIDTILQRTISNPFSCIKSVCFVSDFIEVCHWGPIDNNLSLVQIMAWRQIRPHAIIWTNVSLVQYIYIYVSWWVIRNIQILYFLHKTFIQNKTIF